MFEKAGIAQGSPPFSLDVNRKIIYNESNDADIRRKIKRNGKNHA